MDDAGNSITLRRKPPQIAPLSQADLAMISRVREELVILSIKPPSWRDTDPAKRRRFFDEVRAVLMDLGNNTANINRDAQIVTDALSGVGLLDQLLRDPFVEEIFVRKGEVAVEYDGAFHYLGKLADDRYFEDLAIHVADQGGATLRGDRPAVLIDLPGGERFTAIVPRLSTEGTAINIRTFGRRVKTLEEMECTGTFTKRGISLEGSLGDIADADIRSRIAGLNNGPDRFLAWVAATLSGSILVAGEMGSGKTTLLNALSGFLPRQAPLAALETFRELEIQHPFLLRAVAPAELPDGTSGVTLDWVLDIIYTRMNPAAILVGEVVGPEALQFLKATCLGRKALTTIHGGTVEEALMRLEQLALAATPELGLPAIRSMVAMGLDVVALMGRVPHNGRVERTLQAIALINGVDANGDYR
ncbi:CpaF family protein, partial [bacterium]|nr:CpaF family protein [bacterium]